MPKASQKQAKSKPKTAKEQPQKQLRSSPRGAQEQPRGSHRSSPRAAKEQPDIEFMHLECTNSPYHNSVPLLRRSPGAATGAAKEQPHSKPTASQKQA